MKFSMLLAFAVFSLICALVPVVLCAANLRLYSVPPQLAPGGAEPSVSVIIPARNEAEHIGATLDAVLRSSGVEFEVMVLNDDSTDATAALVEARAAHDFRLRLVSVPKLPTGWNGKQHACFYGAAHARFPLLLFLDADVWLAPDALARLVPLLESADLLSGVPHQITISFSEKLLLPLIHFVLLGYLPFARMRASREPALGAGCGQLFLTTAAAYHDIEGHAAIRSSLHDGLHLPRAYRQAGLRTDLADLTPLAECRMYEGNLATWRGLAKNAHQGMGAPRTIIPMTVLLLFGQVAPWLLLLLFAARLAPATVALVVGGAAVAGFAVRAALARRFHQSWLGAMLHPVGVLGLLGIQWWAFLRHAAGRSSVWKGRECR